jgi:beta-glucosidase
MRERIAELIGELTLEEKAALVTGQDFWTTAPVERLQIPSIWLSDGPHGVRKAFSGDDIGIGGAREATCFPTASALAASWDTGLIEEMGRALARECRALGVQVLLGPGLNIKRSPLGGRNFEYFSEDPFLSGELASAFVQGVQSEGVGTSVKHYACNNQEFERMTISAEVDERTLREVYLAGFERVIKQARPWTVMAAYNRVNGTAATEHNRLLTEILRDEWGFEGCVVSDWSAVTDKDRALLAGLDLEMPGRAAAADEVVQMVKTGLITPQALDRAAARILALVFQVVKHYSTRGNFDQQAHHALARRIAGACFVLLKNDGKLLPLDAAGLGSLAVIGRFAREPRYQGAGSSQVSPTRLDTALDAIVSLLGPEMPVSYAAGYGEDDTPDESLLREAAQAARSCEAAVVFAGLPYTYESEGFDREDIAMPPAHNRLIEAVCRAQPNTVVVLSNGSAVAMPWLSQPKAVLEGWLGGQASGSAAADVLFGAVNPSGKLAETFPRRIEDTPSYLDFPGEEDRVRYAEGLFLGYKYYEKRKIEPLFPFGFGLSYTTFAYSGLTLSADTVNDLDPLGITMQLTNTGSVYGQEVVQLYLRDEVSRLARPLKELKGFRKVALEPGETQTVEFTLAGRDFAYYDSTRGVWCVESGWFEIALGSSSTDIRLQARVWMESTQRLKTRYHKLLPLKHFLADPAARKLLEQTLADWPLGAVLLSDNLDNVFVRMMADMPIIKLLRFGGEAAAEIALDQMIEQLNRQS